VVHAYFQKQISVERKFKKSRKIIATVERVLLLKPCASSLLATPQAF